MKRIIRLTESDLARIVRRVINEGTETTTMTPETVTEFRGVGDRTISGTDKSGNPVTFTITPYKPKIKDDKGNMVADPGKLGIEVKMDGKLNTKALMTYDCKKNIMSYAQGSLDNNYSNYIFSIGGWEAKYDTERAISLLNQSLKGGTYPVKGTIATMISKYCKSV
jgi:hypothetical protein